MSDPLINIGFKLSEETRKRCNIFTVSDAEGKRFRPINPELFHFLYEAQSIEFKIHLKVENVVIEFIKKEEFSRELLDGLWAAMQKSKRRLEICVLASEMPQFELVVGRVRNAKINRLLEQDPSLDRRTLEVFSNLSDVSQRLVKGGITSEIARSVSASATFMVTNLLDSQRAISTLSRMVTHDPTLYDHSATVAMIAASIARHCLEKPFKPRETEILAQCSLYHDVGKTCVPSAILNKPGRFTPEEFEIMKSHTTFGEEELRKAIDSGAPIDELTIRVAGEHHEKFTGKGYPRGRKGRYEEDSKNGIHIYSRIVTIADIYSALLMKRVYKPAFEPQDAIKIMAETAQDDFDPVLFIPFLKGVVASLNKSSHEGGSGRVLIMEAGGKLTEVDPRKKTSA